MKGSTAAALAVPPAKRKWKGLALALVLALVAFSLLVPLAFLLGLHNRFPYGYSTEDRSPSDPGFGNYGGRLEQNHSKNESRINDLVRKFRPSFPKDITVNFSAQNNNDMDRKGNGQNNGGGSLTTSQGADAAISGSKDSPSQQGSMSKTHPSVQAREVTARAKKDSYKAASNVDFHKSCQLRFGSYCLWSTENKEVMKDSTVKRLKDQLFVARAYYPSIAKLKGLDNKLTREVKQNIQEYEKMLSEAISDMDLPPAVEQKMQRMGRTLARAKALTVDCNNIDKKFRQLVDLTEDEALFHMKQSAFLFYLGVQTMPKSLHCLSMRSTIEYFRSATVDANSSHAYKYENPSIRNYIIFSRNIIAASVTINSTVFSSEEPAKMAFHLLTDTQNYYSMKLWFARSSYRDVPVRIVNIEELNLKLWSSPQLSWSEEFRVSFLNVDQSSSLSMKTEYISVFGHSHFLLPHVFKNLKKVVVLDDDVVIQRDLSSLWELDLEGKVNGAIEFCGVKLGQLKSYLGSNSFNDDSCTWMSGLNIIDLDKWREHNVTGIYQNLLHKFARGTGDTWRQLALPASLLAFQNFVYPLDNAWVVSGLGHDYEVSKDAISGALGLHYNGNMKPWLELGIPKYKKYWKNFLTHEDQFMSECNVNP